MGYEPGKAVQALKPYETGKKKAQAIRSFFTRRVSFVDVHFVHKVHFLHCF
jgi:hypothetical protein